MEIVKKIVLATMLLIFLSLMGTLVLKIVYVIFDKEHADIGMMGFKVGFLSFILLVVGNIIYKKRKQ